MSILGAIGLKREKPMARIAHVNLYANRRTCVCAFVDVHARMRVYACLRASVPGETRDLSGEGNKVMYAGAT